MTKAEMTFLNRMLPHMMAGKSLDDAARAVLADDERLWFGTMAQDDIGATIRAELAAQVHAAVLGKAE